MTSRSSPVARALGSRACVLGVATTLALLGACATQPPPADAPPPPVVEVKPAEAKGPPPGSAAARQQTQSLVRSASEALNEGDEERARHDLQLARELDPDIRAVGCLLRGLTADPVTTLGRDATSYTVRPGETMGRIAQRALGDVCEFYLLARYNGLRVPKQLAAGQTIRIPGKVPLAAPDAPSARRQSEPTATSEPPPRMGTNDAPRGAASETLRSDNGAKAPASAPSPTAAEPTAPTAPPDPSAAAAPPIQPAGVLAPSRSAAAVDTAATRSAIDMHARAAQAAFRKQDLATAIREWDQVLALDPGNELARAKRQEAVELDRRAKQLK